MWASEGFEIKPDDGVFGPPDRQHSWAFSQRETVFHLERWLHPTSAMDGGSADNSGAIICRHENPCESETTNSVQKKPILSDELSFGIKA